MQSRAVEDESVWIAEQDERVWIAEQAKDESVYRAEQLKKNIVCTEQSSSEGTRVRSGVERRGREWTHTDMRSTFSQGISTRVVPSRERLASSASEVT